MTEVKYLAIVEWAKDEIRKQAMVSGQKFYSESELCKIHSVSRQTVRQALLQLERDNIVWRERGSGTYVRSLKHEPAKQVLTVGVISTYFSDYIFPNIVTGIEKVLSKNNAAMQLATTQNLVAEEARALKAMLAQSVDALIVEPSKSALPNPNMALYEDVRSRGVPLVFFNAKYPWSDFPCVAIDDVAAGYMATKHLIRLGHEKISGIFMSDNMQGHKRYQGFINCLNDCSVPMPEQHVLWFSTNDSADMFSLSKNVLLALLKSSTAVVCYNDQLAVKMLGFCKSNKLSVPEDISLIGIDDSNLSKICETPLSTIRHPQQLLGEKAAEILIQAALKPGSRPEGKLFAPKLIERMSTKAPRG
jgi:GntR family transcriptional regulator of arabinose operon